METPHAVTLVRDCPATFVPLGDRHVLRAGEKVVITQALGDHLTVRTPHGWLLRVAGEDAGALGPEVAVAVKEACAAETIEGPLTEDAILERLKSVYDPEIPVNVVDLGLIYRCELKNGTGAATGEPRTVVEIDMSMTAPGCGMGDILLEEVRQKVSALPGVDEARVELVWAPPWTPERLSEAARLQLGWY